jgi:hypothetical protein
MLAVLWHPVKRTYDSPALDQTARASQLNAGRGLRPAPTTLVWRADRLWSSAR